ncbi:MAG: ferrochelatase [Myxococcales bacterium]|nr:ferrochelatase [Myxococcales bacterium]
MSVTGLLLCNLGTPDDPSPGAVRRYLAEFLADPRVLDINAVARWALLNLIILPFRPAKSAHAYQQIWTDRGSPLLFHTQDLATAVRERLGDGWAVEVGMRYQSPSLASALERLRAAGADRVVVMPLYPQYSAASTGSSNEEVFRLASKPWVTPTLSFVEPFFEETAFIDAFVAQGRPVLEAERPDHVVMSFHGLPERHMRKADDTGKHCLASAGCCDRLVAANRNCYRAQCFATARALSSRLALPEGGWTVTFQSRLGRTPWIRPYTDLVLPELVACGKKRVVVFCPAFVADCLETLEEIGIRAKRDFLAAGGESLALVPSLNATAPWADAVVALARGEARGRGERGALGTD